MNCVKCGNPIPVKRIEILPNTRTCVSCSTTNKLVGVPIAVGKGEEVYNDLNIMTPETYRQFLRLQKGTFEVDSPEGGEA